MNPNQTPERSGNKRRRLSIAVFTAVALFMGLTIAAAAPQAEAAARCSGAPSQNVYTARGNYKINCGETWDGSSGVHKCDYGSKGYTCSGPVTNDNCSSNWSQTFKKALEGFHRHCGEEFDYRDSRHHCVAIGGAYQFKCWRGDAVYYKYN